jgi:DNA modification methylase
LSFYRLYHGDCLDVLDSFDDKSVDVIITDPPYGLGFDYPSYDDTVDNLIALINGFMPKARNVSDRVYVLSGITPMFLYPKPDWVISCSWNTTGSYGKHGYTQWMPILCLSLIHI